MRKEKNSNVPMFLCFIIGCLLMIAGVAQILEVSNYEETIGQFTHSEEKTSTDSDGYTNTYYVWHYNFFVNDIEYIAKSGNNSFETPNNYEEKVLYNPENPTENIISTDYSAYVLVIVGVVFTSIIFFFKKPKGMDSATEKRMSEKKAAWFVILFTVAIFIILLLQVNFSIKMLVLHMFFPTLIILLFLGVGIYLLKRAYNPHLIQTDTTLNNSREVISENNSINLNISTACGNNDLLNTSDVKMNEEQVQKIGILVQKYKGIAGIVLGLIWCGIILFPTIISAIFVLFSLSNEDSMYTVNGEEVSSVQFIFSSLSPITLVFLVFGIIIIIKGIRDIVACKKIEKR